MEKEIVRKRYTLLSSFSLAFPVKMEDGLRLIKFMGGNMGLHTKGFFITDDPKVQEALEKCPNYGKDFVCTEEHKRKVEDVVIPEPRVFDENSPKAEEPEAEGETTEEAEKPAEEKTPEQEALEAVTSKAKAQAYLNDLFPDDKTALSKMNTAEMKAYAKEKGIVFPNWA